MLKKFKKEQLLRLNEERSFNTNRIAGVGLSARPQHYSCLLETKRVPWLEVLGDNYLYPGSPSHKKLERLSQIYSLCMHFVGFNLGSSDPVDSKYLKRVKSLVSKFNPEWVSDHLCFCKAGDLASPDLLPIPYNEGMLERVSSKVEKIKEELGVEFLVENVSHYLMHTDSVFTEEEFLTRLVDKTNCGILLDVNNLYVNSMNYGFDPFKAFLKLPLESIYQIHLAGHTDYGTHIVDTHSEDIQEPVLKLFKKIIDKIGNVPVTIERDENIPPFENMIAEVERVKWVYDRQIN